MLGMALDPDFDNGRPYVYVSYAYDKTPVPHADLGRHLSERRTTPAARSSHACRD